MTDHHHVSTITMHALKFLDLMFVARGYNLKTRRRFYVAKKNLWQVFISDIVCVLTPCPVKKSETLDKLHIVSSIRDENGDAEVFGGNWKHVLKTFNIGTDFIQALTDYGKDQSMSQIILISSTVTGQAEKAIQSSDMKIVHFSYAETAVPSLLSHFLQPRCFRKLDDTERSLFVKAHPRYQQELSRYSIMEPIVKYRGFSEGDIVECSDDNIQGGDVRRFAIVVSRV